MSRWHRAIEALVLCASALLGACGGGGSSDTGTPAPSSHSGSFSLSMAGGSATGYDHVWVTIDRVALTVDANRPWSATDPAWTVVRFSSPMTFDLAALTNGLVASLVVGKPIAAGTYGQLRLFLVPPDAALAASAKDRQLSYNDQVDTTGADGTAHYVPLELGDNSLGLRVAGPIAIAADTNSDLSLQIDVDHDLVRFASAEGQDRFLLRPQLQRYDLDNTGAIVGLLDKSLFCPAGERRSDCIYDAVASANVLSSDGRFERSVRAAPVVIDGSYAKFGLYPLPALADGQFYDVVVRGRNMRTIVVRNVPAPPDPLLQAPPTELGANPGDPLNPIPMVPVLAASDAAIALSQPMAQRSSQLLIGQTLPGGSAPLEVAAANVDPFSGLLAVAAPLSPAPLRVATYDAKLPLSFSDMQPAEGAGGFTVMSVARRVDDPSASATFTLNASGVTPLVAPEPALQAALASAQLNIGFTGAPSRGDTAELIVSDVNGIVWTQDVSALITTPNAQLSLTLPAGSAVAALDGGAVYDVALRVWTRGATDGSLRWAYTAPVDLRAGTDTSISVAWP